MRGTRAAACAAALLVLAACGSSVRTGGGDSFRAPTPASAETDAETRARLHTELASAYYELGNMAIALEEANMALQSSRSYGPAYNIAGLIYAELKEDRLARQNFEQALRVNPSDSDALNNYGRFLCDRKQEAEGIKYLLAAIRNPLYETPDRSYVNAGLCSQRRGDVQAAEDYFGRALKLRPNQPQALYQLADMAYRRGAYREAKDYLTRLTQVAAPNAETLWLGVRVERRLGDRDAAATYSVQLAKNFPGSKEAQALSAGREE